MTNQQFNPEKTQSTVERDHVTGFLIQSESEKGFWSNIDGWVHDIVSATVFETIDHSLHLPISSGSDALYVSINDNNLIDFDD